jgi:uncharacterized membrane protein
MIAHPFGYLAVILLQQVLILGLVWSVVHLAERSRRERRRYCSAKLLSNAAATNDLAALAVQLSKPSEASPTRVPLRTSVRVAEAERV